VMAGYPGTIAATWQRAGRAGRRSGRSAAVLVASSAPVDQFVARHPDYFFGASPEHALVNPDNLHILLDHVKCAAFELPFSDGDIFGSINVDEVLQVLSEEGFVHHTEGQWQWTHESYPADAVSLRSVTSDNFVIVDLTNGERVIGETDFTSGPSVLHEKAIYILEGQLFQVEKLDFDNRKAFVRAVECDYYTDAIDYTKVTILEIFAGDAMPQPEVADAASLALAAAGLEPDEVDRNADSTLLPSALLPSALTASSAVALRSHGEVHVVSRVVGFKKIKFYTNENIGAGELDLPEQNMHTTSYWLRIPAELMAALPYSTDDRRDGIAGIAFAMHNIAPLLLMSDQGDIGVSIDRETIFLYDNYPGGIGFSEPLFAMHDELLARTKELIDECPCQSGCPSCVGPEGATGPHTKAVATDLLSRLSA